MTIQSMKTDTDPWHIWKNNDGHNVFPTAILVGEYGACETPRWYIPERTCIVLGEEYDELLDMFSTDLSCDHTVYMRASEFEYCSQCGAKVVE